MVEKKKIEVEVTKEAYELIDGIKNLIVSIKEATKDGWQTGNDLPVVMTSALANLIPAVNGAEKIPAESQEELEAFITGIMVKSKEIGFLFYKKKEQ